MAVVVNLSSRGIPSSYLYPMDPMDLWRGIEECFTHKVGPGQIPPGPEPKGRVCGMLVPHGVLAHAGSIAAHGYYYISGLRDIDTVVLIGPVHEPAGVNKVSVYPNGSWQTPLGSIDVDVYVANQIATSVPSCAPDVATFNLDDSLDMHIPFLQYIFSDKPFKIVPILMYNQNVETALALGKVVGKLVKDKKGILVIGTTNLTHNMVYAQALRRDALIYDLLQRPAFLEVKKIYDTVIQNKLTVCGYGPMMALITVAQQLGSKTGLNLKYATSGETEGNYANVIGYSATVFL